MNTALSRQVLKLYNRFGPFEDLSDSEQGIREILSKSFEAVELQVVGSIAIFRAAKPRQIPT